MTRDHKEIFNENLGAAQQGDARAQFNIGVMYSNGMGVKKDSAEAAKWYRLAAEQGDAFGQGLIGHMYANGWGVTQDYVAAYMWFSLAAGAGYEATTKKELGKLTAAMKPGQIAEAKRLAAAWKPTPAPSAK